MHRGRSVVVVFALLAGCPEKQAPPPPPTELPVPPPVPKGPTLREISKKNAEGKTLLDLIGTIGREQLDALQPDFEKDPESFLFLSSLSSLTVDQTNEIREATAKVIVLNGLTKLGYAVNALAESKAEVLVLDGLTSLEDTDADTLRAWHGKKLFLDALGDLDPETAKRLAWWGGELLSLRGLQQIRPESAAALAKFKGKVAISVTPPGKKYTQSIDPETLRKLSKAIVGGRIAEVRTYLEGGGTPDANENGTTLLMEACYFKETEIAKLLLSKGASVNSRSQDGQTALCYSLHYPFGLEKQKNYDKVMALAMVLLEAKANVNPEGVEKPPLTWAAEFEYTPLLKLLLDAGADPKGTDARGYDALIAAINKGHCTAVQLLLERGAIVNPTKLLPGGMPLHQAISQRASEMEMYLYKNKEPDPEDLDAMARNARELVGILVKAGADVEALDHRKWTPLMTAVNGGELFLVQEIIKKGAKVDRKDESGTILHFAAGCGRLKEDAIVPLVQQILLEGSTDKAAKNKDGLTAADVADKRGWKKLAALLAP